GGADHDDVLRRHLVPQRRREVLAPPTVPERDGDCALGVALPDHVAVELGDDLDGGQLPAVDAGGHSSSTVTWSFVYTQIPAATRTASTASACASGSECATGARPAPGANAPPEPIPISPSS